MPPAFGAPDESVAIITSGATWVALSVIVNRMNVGLCAHVVASTLRARLRLALRRAWWMLAPPLFYKCLPVLAHKLALRLVIACADRSLPLLYGMLLWSIVDYANPFEELYIYAHFKTNKKRWPNRSADVSDQTTMCLSTNDGCIDREPRTWYWLNN